MKLTKEQRESIEADGLGREILNCIEVLGVLNFHSKELKRTIKRIDDERIFLQNVEIPRYTYSGEVRDLKIFYFDEIKKRIKELIQQKNLYELMETLE